VSACNSLRKDGCKEIAADANIVLGCLYQKQRSYKDKTYDEEEKYFQRALCLRPDDWRIHTMLSTTYVMAGQASLSLQSITQALHHAKSAKARFNLLQKRGKLLCNLSRKNDAIACLEQVMVEYEEIKKDLSPEETGDAAVSQYALCSQYAESNAKNRYKKQLSHWKQAEAKRNALPADVQNTFCWDFRDMAQILVAKIKPEAALSHRECHYCHHTTDNAMRCSACKVAVYCSKDCQVKGWKSGHKQECAGSKATRKQSRKHSKVSPPATLIDEHIPPRSLWKEANKLSKAGNPEEAVWLYLVALFLDLSLNLKSNLTEAKKAVEKCGRENIVARVLSIVTHNDNKPLEKCASVSENFTTEEITRALKKKKEDVKTFEEVDRGRFSIGVSYIFWARWHARMFSIKSGVDPKVSNKAFKVAAELIGKARIFINPESWLTYQYELGYSNFDMMAFDEGKFWLKKFVFNLNLCQKNSHLSMIHWKQSMVSAHLKLDMISMLEQNLM
jgi:tetratricopeptide (TPR) repeat protein